MVIKINWTYEEIIYTGNFFQRLFKIGPKKKVEKPKLEVAAILYDVSRKKQVNLVYYGNLKTPGIIFDGDKTFEIDKQSFSDNYWLLFFAYTDDSLEGVKNISINEKIINPKTKGSGIWIGSFGFSENKFIIENIPLNSKGITENVLEISKKVVE